MVSYLYIYIQYNNLSIGVIVIVHLYYIYISLLILLLLTIVCLVFCWNTFGYIWDTLGICKTLRIRHWSWFLTILSAASQQLQLFQPRTSGWVILNLFLRDNDQLGHTMVKRTHQHFQRWSRQSFVPEKFRRRSKLFTSLTNAKLKG